MHKKDNNGRNERTAQPLSILRQSEREWERESKSESQMAAFININRMGAAWLSHCMRRRRAGSSRAAGNFVN